MDDVHAWSVKLTVEREARQRDARAWSDRNMEFKAENDDFALRTRAELTTAETEIAAIEELRKADGEAAHEDDSNRLVLLQELAVRAVSLEVAVQTRRTVAAALRERCKYLESDRQKVDEDLRALTAHKRGTDAALDATT